MNKSPEEMQQAYRSSCTHYRNGNKVFKCSDNSVVFDGMKGRQKSQGLGINAAKRFTRNLRSFTV